MSYCRWSSNNFQCDVYCYEHVDGGFMVHVAGRRHVNPAPRPEDGTKYLMDGNVDAYMKCHKEMEAWLEAATMQDIGLPHDGETFVEPDAAAAADRLKQLRAIGYLVPDFAIEALESEASEEASRER